MGFEGGGGGGGFYDDPNKSSQDPVISGGGGGGIFISTTKRGSSGGDVSGTGGNAGTEFQLGGTKYIANGDAGTNATNTVRGLGGSGLKWISRIKSFRGWWKWCR